MAKYLHGFHDPGGERLMADKPGWIVFTVSLSANQRIDFRPYTDKGFTPIVRLNWGYGSTGTIPLPDKYQEMAAACQRFASDSPTAKIFVIGNEPNHINERPDGQVIKAEDYASCFNLCRDMIKAVRPDAQVLMAGIAPWNQQTGDWVEYFRRCAALCNCDGFALHAYTHGADPALVVSDAKVEGWYWHFRVYRTQLENVPQGKRGLPTYITETDQDHAWLDVKSGYVVALMREIYEWNQRPDTQKVLCVALYRWEKHEDDKWSISDHPQVQADFADAVRQGFLSPANGGLVPDSSGQIFMPDISTGSLPAQRDQWPMYWDTRLTDRGVVVVRPENLRPGEFFYDVYGGKWMDVEQAQGRHHIYTNAYNEDHKRLMGTKFLVRWPMPDPNKSTMVVAEKNEEFSANYPMSKSLREYSIEVQESLRSSVVKFIGMGANGNPAEHTSTIVEFQMRRWPGTEPEPEPEPVPPTPNLMLLISPVPNGAVTQRWGERPEVYQKMFGIPYHNGLDLAAPEGSPVIAPADGVVAWVDYDATGYGNYVRLFHAQLGMHTFMAHLQKITVQKGQTVKQGQQVGLLGNTGNSTGPHVHFEIRLGKSIAGYEPGTFGHGNGRVDPQTVLYFFR